MNFAFNEEQEELRKTVRQFLEAKSPESAVREQMDTEVGYDAAVWSQMGEQLGLQGLVIPEEFGGSGYGFIELVVVLEEMGRALLCAPFFSSVVLAANAVVHSGDDSAKADLLPGIASGETIATLAFTEENGRWDEEGITATASGSGDSWTIDGTKTYVLDGHVASLLIVAARTANGVSLFAVDGDGQGVTRTSLATMDQTRKQAKIELSGAAGRLIGAEGQGWAVLERVLDLAAVALAAEQVGGAQFCLEMAVQYAKDRVQFGQPIGDFQLIQDKLARMEVARLNVENLVFRTIEMSAAGRSMTLAEASAMKLYSARAATEVALEAVQVLGGNGYMSEFRVEQLARDAKVLQIYAGTDEIQITHIAKDLLRR